MKDAADSFAGTWILQRTILNTEVKIEAARTLNQVAAQNWNVIQTDSDQFTENVCDSSGLNGDELNTFRQDFTASVEAYRNMRDTEKLWKECMGKQALGVIYQDFGMSSVESLQNNITRIWENDEATVPTELHALREYINSIE